MDKDGTPDRLDITENNIMFLLKFIRFFGHKRPKVFAELMAEFEELGGEWMIEGGKRNEDSKKEIGSK